MTIRKRQNGFTLVELSLAILMVSLLAMAILSVSLQIMKMFSKGVTLKSVNQVSRDFSTQLTSDLRSAPVSQINISQVSNGRFCIGSYAYLWNTSSQLQQGTAMITYKNGSPLHLVRVLDPNQHFCTSTSAKSLTSSDTFTDFLGDQSGNSANNLAIYNMSVQPLVSSNQIYSVDYALGTNEQGTTSGVQCKPPSDNQANFDFCTVATFHLVVKVSDEGNGGSG